MSRYFNCLAKRTGLPAPAHVTSLHQVTGAAPLNASERRDADPARLLEIHAENVIGSEGQVTPAKPEHTQRHQLQPDIASMHHDPRQQADSAAQTQTSKHDSVTTSPVRTAPAVPAQPAQRSSQPVATPSKSKNPRHDDVQAVVASAEPATEIIETLVISASGPDTAGILHDLTEPARPEIAVAVRTNGNAADAAVVSHVSRRSTQPGVLRQASVEARSDTSTSDQSTAGMKPDHPVTGKPVASRQRGSVNGDAVHKTEPGRSSHGGDLKIAIGKIDLQVHQQQHRPEPVARPVKARQPASKPAGLSNLSRFYFRWHE